MFKPLRAIRLKTRYNDIKHNIKTLNFRNNSCYMPSSLSRWKDMSLMPAFLISYCALWGPWQNFLIPPHTLATTIATLWRWGQAKSWPCGERWAHSAYKEGQLCIWSMVWLSLTVMRRVLYMKHFIYMFQKISLLLWFLQDVDAQNVPQA